MNDAKYVRSQVELVRRGTLFLDQIGIWTSMRRLS